MLVLTALVEPPVPQEPKALQVQEPLVPPELRAVMVLLALQAHPERSALQVPKVQPEQAPQVQPAYKAPPVH